VSRILNRPLAEMVALFIAKRAPWVTPNMVSIASFALALVASILIAMGYLPVGGVLVQISSIVDGVDGSLARITGRASRSGGFLDTMLDRYADIAVYAGIAWFLAANGEISQVDALVLVAALSGDLAVSYLHTRGERDAGVHPALIGPLDSLASRDVRLFILFLALVLRAPLPGLMSVALLSHLYVAVKSLYVYTHIKEGRM
ncbi:MAG: CDP-alcohol phosphatidyltransferase family protein, partial [Desulfurococcales archaeon]|nr:CDP-alcohol phosphatidyltransferase family protein [Desulfurococcales archaeon]